MELRCKRGMTAIWLVFVAIVVGAPAFIEANEPPIVNAGPDRVEVVGGPYRMAGSAVDDGLPAEMPLITGWSMVSGPGAWAMSNLSDPTGTMSFAFPGTYTMRLTAFDGEFQVHDDMVFILTSAANVPPRITAESDKAIRLPAGVSLRFIVSDSIGPGEELLLAWTKESGPGIVTFTDPTNNSTTANFSLPGVYRLVFTASDGQYVTSAGINITVLPAAPNNPPTVDAGAGQIVTLPAPAQLVGVVNDDGLPTGGTLVRQWSRVSGPEGEVVFANPSAAQTTATFPRAGTYILRLLVQDGEFSAADDVVISVHTPPSANERPTANAGLDRVVSLPAAATLTGIARDDRWAPPPTGFPPMPPIIPPLVITWSLVSGPAGGVATIANPGVQQTTVSFDRPGTYVFRMSVFDGLLTGTDDVSITVNAAGGANRTPLVNAGPDLTAIRTDVVLLEGQVADDGLPLLVPLGVEWVRVSGPGTVDFGSLKNSARSSARFSANGEYVLRLNVTDSLLSAFDEIRVTILPPPFNIAPIVMAGADQVVTLPNIGNLEGFAGDDGNPYYNPQNPHHLSVLWRLDSGPAPVKISEVDSDVTSVQFSAPGIYEFTLTADDTLLSNFDAVRFTVNAAAPQNLAPIVSAGPDQTITLPSQAVINGSVTDATIPAGGTLTADWTQVTGPAPVTFTPSNTAPTRVTFGFPGTYVLRLRGFDSAVEAFDDVQITVNPAPIINQPPVVNAGTDQTIALPNVAQLNGRVTDDGRPAGGTLTSQWTLFSGPTGGQVTFGNAAAQITTAQFSAAGNYVLRLTGRDTQLTVSDDVTIVVDPRNLAPVVNAGTDVTIRLPSGAQLNGTVTDDNWPRSSVVSYSWSVQTSPNQSVVQFGGGVTNLRSFATFSVPGRYVLRLTANDMQLTTTDDVTIDVLPANNPPTVNAGADFTINLPSLANLSGQASDDGQPSGAVLDPTWTVVSQPVGANATFANSKSLSTTANLPLAGTYVLRLTVSDTLTNGTDTIQVTVLPVANQRPTVSAGPDQTVTLPGSTFLSGSVTDLDNLPAGRVLTGQWTRFSGPTGGVVTFGNANAIQTTVGFSIPGIYVLRLTGSDSQLTNTDDVQITVNAPVNQPPQVSAGTNQTITLPSVAQLNGTVTDDGLPIGSTLLIEWSRISGPTGGVVTFGNVNAPQTTASFSLPGTYQLQLRASDSATSVQVGVTITVNPAPPVNRAPIVNAGADQAITLPSATALTGTITDDGLPTGAPVTAGWTMQSGPAGGVATFANANAAQTAVSFNLPGTYVLRLRGFDTALEQTDTVQITVSPAPPTNRAPTVAAGVDQTITLPASATLVGSVTDDGLPTGAAVTATWSRVSGPTGGVATFANANAAQTSVSFSAAGTYVLRLRGFDTQLAGTDDIQIIVNPAPPVNRVPTVNAGSDQAITLGQSASLTGSVTDDGLPTGAAVTAQWSLVSGPTGGVATFVNANSALTSVSFNLSGTYVLRLRGFDTALAATDDITIVVSPAPPTNRAPTVSAGIDQTITLPASANLTGSVTDDGLPTGATLTSLWSVVNAPTGGVATFVSASNAQTSVSFSLPGTYVLRLRGFDTQLANTDDIQIIVNPAPPVNRAPVANAGSDQVVTLPASANLNGSVTDDGLPTGITVTATWSRISGPTGGVATFTNANAAQTSVSFSAAGTYVLQLRGFDSLLAHTDTVQITVNPAPPTNRAPTVSAGIDQSIALPASANLIGSVTDDGLPSGAAVTAQWSMISFPTGGVATFAGATSAQTSVSFSLPGTYVLRLRGFDTQLAATDDIQIIVSPAPQVNRAPTVNAGTDVTITLPSVANLNASVTDDGLPTGALVTAQWTRFSGPTGGVVTFGNATNVDTTASFSLPGTYVLRLTGSDTTLSASDDVTIVVNLGNQAPVVTAGTDLTITLPNSAQLNGTVTDDGLPTGGTLTRVWNQVSGPNLGVTSFANANAAQTTASFSLPGVYVLRLSASDSERSGSDEISVTVNPAPQVNVAPTVSAGIDQTILLSGSAQLNGSVTDDGLPTGGTLTRVWSRVSGPLNGVVTFGNVNSVQTTASFSREGVYVLRLTGHDSALSATDDIQITVNLPPVVNQSPVANAGPDQSINLPGFATLNGRVTDDELPAGAALTARWSFVNGPASVIFGNANAAQTTVAFEAVGTYVLRLTASDTAFSHTDDVTVTVSPAADTTFPQVFITSPRDGEILGGLIQIAAIATDDRGPLRVNFYVDGSPEGNQLTAAPFRWTWDSRSVPDGDYTLEVEALDGASNRAVETIRVSVRNSVAAAAQPAPKMVNMVYLNRGQSVEIPVQPGQLEIEAYDKSGGHVFQVWMGEAPGGGIVRWNGEVNGEKVASGMYLLHIKTDRGAEVRKVILVK